MKNNQIIILGVGIASFLALLAFSNNRGAEPVSLQYPANWPAPVYDFTKNPLTRQGIELGRRLFYDPVLSRDSTVSCASCHLSYTAFTHVDHALSHGIEDRLGQRNSLVLMNLAWSTNFMWDGAINHLDFQALAPISAPSEMDNTIQSVVKSLNATAHYPALFEAAFGSRHITGERVLKAIAQFELTLISSNSRYDQMLAGQETFNIQEQNGYLIFQKNCAHCHTEPLLTNFDFEKNGLPLDTALNDFGRMRVTQNPADSLRFKVPTLRNIEFSYPYMHDGRFKKLRDVVHFYNESSTIRPGLKLTAAEKTDIMAFLLTLTDKKFLFDPQFSFPRN